MSSRDPAASTSQMAPARGVSVRRTLLSALYSWTWVFSSSSTMRPAVPESPTW